MKREDLEALGLSKEQVDKVLDIHHKEYDPVKKDLDTAQACSLVGWPVSLVHACPLQS